MTAQKPADRRAGAQPAKRALAAVPVVPRPAPEPRKEWLAQTKQRWEVFWASPVAKAAHEVDIPIIETTFDRLDEIQRLKTAGRRKRIVEGSTGQPRINPLLSEAYRLEDTLPKFFAEIGLTPKARAALAINVGQAQKTIDDLNREVEADVDDDDWGGTSVVESVAPEA